MKAIDMIGQRLGRLTVVGRAPNIRKKVARWTCVCECGKTTTIRASDLRRADRPTRSCGCISRELAARLARTLHVTHGLSGTREYSIWCMMLGRCSKPSHSGFPDYGGRGITVCPEWINFEQFWKDMGPRPSPEHSIERIDNNKGYGPSNCCWATQDAQANNKRTNRVIEWHGKRMTVAQWARRLGFPDSRLRQRIARGWNLDQAMTMEAKR